MPTVMSCHLAAHHVLAALRNLGLDASPLKLIKLTYISHGYYLAIAGKSLLHESVQAWRYGPVIPEIYYAVKGFKKNSVPHDLFAAYPSDDNTDGAAAKSIIDRVIDAYGEYDGLQLSAATHKNGTPWHKIYKKEGDKAVIPNALIREYYRNLMQ